MNVYDSAEALAYRDSLPLSWTLLAEPPSGHSLERQGETNVNVLARVVSLEDRHSLAGEEGELEKEIGRLNDKMDLLIELVAQLARERLQLPPVVELLLSARTLVWMPVVDVPLLGSRVMIALYLNPCIAEPLRLPAVIERCENRQVHARFEHPSESCQSALEQHVFLRHRRSVAENRKLSAE